MRTLISHYSNPPFLFKFTSSFPQINYNPTFYLHQKCLLKPHNIPIFRASCSINSGASYNGWDDLRHWVDSDELGKSNHIKKLILYLGIDDREYAFTCVLGFVIALAISRVRVSTIVVFPAAFIVFAIGFSFGFFSSGLNYKGFSSNGVSRRVKDGSLGVYVEKLKALEKLFDGFDVKLSDLKSVVKKAIDDERVDLSELESYVILLESIGGFVLDARNVVEVGSFELQEVEKKSNRKSSRNKNGVGNNGFNLLGFFGSFLRDYGVNSNGSKRNVLRRESIAKDVENRAQKDMRGSRVDQPLDAVPTISGSTSEVVSINSGRKNKFGGRTQEMEGISESDLMSGMEAHIDSTSFLDNHNDGFNYKSRFTDNQSFSFNMSSHRELRNWLVDEGMSSYTESWRSGQNFGNFRENVEFGKYKNNFSHERMNIEDELHTRKYQTQTENDRGPFSSSTDSDDILFDKYLTKASEFLKQAKECLKGRNDEMFAEEMLHESAKLLSQAIALKPMSLLAIGKLGNTYLLHGELKLRASRELRNHLSGNQNFDRESHSDLLSSVNQALLNKESIATSLGKACEDCEALLVQAGRKYRTALTIDGNDLRALYNWGLALFFRAQLIADIGPEAALDADKLFRAAINKFDAIMSRSNDYAPEALFRWGMALQQRSRLRPSSSRDKVKLLQQAKRLYKDALDMGSDNLQVRKALSSCMSELN